MSKQDLRLLCLDGGGVRGLASLYVLKQAMTHISHLHGRTIKPCDFFDMICGTSTGGLIAIMLGRLEMSIDACITAFTTMMTIIFSPTTKRHLPIEWHSGKVRARYPSASLDAAIRDIIASAGYDRDARLRDPKRSACKTFVVALADEGSVTTRLTDYPRRNEQQSAFYDGVTILEAARATSAATSFFPPVDITSANVTRRFHDGALGANNPVNELWIEAGNQFLASDENLEDRIRSILSIGTGRPVQRVFGEGVRDVASSIAAIATETQRTAEQFHAMRMGLVRRRGYVRFNPPDLSEVGLDEAGKKGMIAQRCEYYGEDVEVREKMEEWARTVGGEMRTVEVQRTTLPVKKNQLFYTLGRDELYVKRNAKSPWQYLTMVSYRQYEKIYDACKRGDGNVEFSAFLKQFDPKSTPSPIMIMKTWAQTLRNKSNPRHSANSKPLTMAVLYMLHVGVAVEGVSISVDDNRREILKRFTKWVPCQCKGGCNRQWNFVNEVGLCKNEDKEECKMVGLSQGTGWYGFGRGKLLRKWQAMQDQWYSAS
ncbi:hypothetical protein B9Z65_7205 [Elsinoe australis]|uniref:PNPLA domain-containing protein n=1 Tax=Elsinoe australis TaxID=40998 RepID=A0A2P7Z664_9PEZI|nr:hypothetical protein B9Z65_7205 [Elsinoe australis]